MRPLFAASLSRHDRVMKGSTKLVLGFVTTLVVIFACSSSKGPGNGSAICGINGADNCRMGEICSNTLGCVQCGADSDCPATDPRCIEGRCELCATNADCPATMPACWADHRCHAACTTSADCTQGGLTLCDTSTGDCIGCKTNADCTGTQHPLCDTTAERCVDCLENKDCGAAAPRCFLGDHTCVECLANSDCGTGQICQPGEFTCHAGCTSNSNCSGATPLCNTVDSQCVQCLANSDCPTTAPLCNTDRGRCSVCLVNTDCKDPTKPICDNQGDVSACVQCVENRDCPTTAPNCRQNVCGP
jgi:Cys-rich repeat protein